MGWFFGFFFLSGFCSILYELVWLRLTMAQFGVTTALTSIVLSMFMTGLGLGSWGAGTLTRRYGARLWFSSASSLRTCRVADRIIFAGSAGRAGVGTLPAGIDDGTECLLVRLLLPGFWITGGCHSAAVVYVHGGYVSAGHVCHPQSGEGRISTVIQLPLPGKRDWRCGRSHCSSLFDRVVWISWHHARGHHLQCDHRRVCVRLDAGTTREDFFGASCVSRGTDLRGAPDRHRSTEERAGPALLDGPGDDGHGGDLDQAVHAVRRSGRVLVCVHLDFVSVGHVCGIVRLPAFQSGRRN